MILGLDCATKTGWCLLKGGTVYESGVQDFSRRRGESNGAMFLKFRRWLREMIVDHGVTLLAYEMAHFRGGAATEICVGMQTRVQEAHAEHGIECVPVETQALKKWVTGKGRRGKEEMIAEARKVLGREPVDDNEADAVHVARWAHAEYGVD